MTRLVADTNVLSYLFKGHSLAPAYAEKLRGAQVAYALQTWAELRAWALAGGWGERRRADLDDFLGDFVLLLPDEQIASHWAAVTVQARRRGLPIDAADAWVAATALALNCPLVTHNVADFAGIAELEVVTVPL